MNHKAIYALYSNVATIDDGAGAFDKDGNKVEIDLAADQPTILILESVLIFFEVPEYVITSLPSFFNILSNPI